jgi:hypothetical protein
VTVDRHGHRRSRTVRWRRRGRRHEERWWAWPEDNEAAELLARAQRQLDDIAREEAE